MITWARFVRLQIWGQAVIGVAVFHVRLRGDWLTLGSVSLGHQTETGRCPWRRGCFFEMLPILTLSFDCNWRREEGSCSI